jgi:hypothetical protein
MPQGFVIIAYFTLKLPHFAQRPLHARQSLMADAHMLPSIPTPRLECNSRHCYVVTTLRRHAADWGTFATQPYRWLRDISRPPITTRLATVLRRMPTRAFILGLKFTLFRLAPNDMKFHIFSQFHTLERERHEDSSLRAWPRNVPQH